MLRWACPYPAPALVVGGCNLLGQLDEGNDQPSSHFAPHLCSPHLHEHLHALQHAQPCQELLLCQ